MRGWWEGLRGGDQTRPQNDGNLRRNNNPNNIYPETYAPWDHIWPNTLKQTPLPLGNQSLNRIGGHYQYLAPSIRSIEDTSKMIPDDMQNPENSVLLRMRYSDTEIPTFCSNYPRSVYYCTLWCNEYKSCLIIIRLRVYNTRALLL